MHYTRTQKTITLRGQKDHRDKKKKSLIILITILEVRHIFVFYNFH